MSYAPLLDIVGQQALLDLLYEMEEDDQKKTKQEFAANMAKTIHEGVREFDETMMAKYLPMHKNMASLVSIEVVPLSNLKHGLTWKLEPTNDTLLASMMNLNRAAMGAAGIRHMKVDSAFRVGEVVLGLASFHGSYELGDVFIDEVATSRLTIFQVGYVIAGRSKTIYIDVFATNRRDLASLAEIVQDIRVSQEVLF